MPDQPHKNLTRRTVERVVTTEEFEPDYYDIEPPTNPPLQSPAPSTPVGNAPEPVGGDDE